MTKVPLDKLFTVENTDICYDLNIHELSLLLWLIYFTS